MVTTKLSSKGQVVLPRLVRSKLRLAAGMKLVCEVRGNSVVLTPKYPGTLPKEYVTDSLTGLRVTKSREGFEPVSSDLVRALLEEFP